MTHYHKIILFFISCCISIGVGEWYVRTYNRQLTLEDAQAFSFNCFDEGEHRWIKLAKNKTCILKSAWNAYPPVAVQTNSIGLRNPEVQIPKPEGTKRILFVGDSFTMGWGVKESDTFVRLSESLIRQKIVQFPVETINAGFTASGPSGYYIFLKYFGLDLDPDIIVVGFFIGNDITARTDVEWVKTNEQGLPDVVRSKSYYVNQNGSLRYKDTPLRFRVPFLNNSHAFLLLANSILPLQASEDPSKEQVDQLSCLLSGDCHDLDTSKSEVKFLFSGIQKLVKSKGKRLIVMMIPDELQVNTYPTFKVTRKLPVLPSERRRINNEFATYFQSEGIEYIDLLPEFMNNAKEQLYIIDDWHFNEKGHAFAATIISEALAKILSNE